MPTILLLNCRSILCRYLQFSSLERERGSSSRLRWECSATGRQEGRVVTAATAVDFILLLYCVLLDTMNNVTSLWLHLALTPWLFSLLTPLVCCCHHNPREVSRWDGRVSSLLSHFLKGISMLWRRLTKRQSIRMVHIIWQRLHRCLAWNCKLKKRFGVTWQN